MKNIPKKIHTRLMDKKGFSLIEVMISLAVISILILGVYGLIVLSIRITTDNKNYVSAIEIANQKMEQIRNMSYDDVGVVLGVPTGLIPQVETIVQGSTFTVNNYITFYDDPYDGEAGTGDTIITDYKIATVKVSWNSNYGSKEVTIFSKIIPRTEETSAGYGLLKIYAVNSSGSPVPSANIRIKNDSIPIDQNLVTGTDGILYYPAPQSFQDYEITVSKPGYGIDYTFGVTSSLSPIHLSVTDGDKTEESFSIDKLSVLDITTYSDNTPANWLINNAISANTRSKPQSSTDGSGNIYFTWQDNAISTSSVFIQKYNSSNIKQWTNDIKIANTNNQSSPDIVTTSGGQSFVVWQDNSIVLKQTTLSNQIKYAKNNKKYTYSPIDRFNFSFLKNLKTNLSFLNFNDLHYKIFKTISNTFFINQTHAQTTGTIIQSKKTTLPKFNNNDSLTFDTPPTNGNVIIVIASQRNTNGTFNPPSSSSGTFTETIYSDPSWSLDVGMWHRVVGVSEASQINITSNHNFNGGAFFIIEVSGLDTADLVDVVTLNDQTGSNSDTANTGTTAVTTNNGFAVSAVTFADNNFNTPNSSNWSSISSNSWTHSLWQDWSWGWDGSLGIATMDIDNANTQRGTLTLSGGGSEQRNSIIAVFNVENPSTVTISEAGSQTPSITIPSTDQYIGGTFVFTDNTGTHSITDITINENGIVDAQNDLSNIKLFYDTDTSAPYDCASETYNPGSDSQFGGAQTFNGADGSASFNEPMGINIDTTNSLCLYVVLDVDSTAVKDDTIKIEVTNPSIDITIDAGLVTPNTPITLTNTTNLLTPADPQQVHYRFRNDDGDEATATWNSTEDSNINLKANNLTRLRFEVSNEGSLDNVITGHRIEYGLKSTTCDAISTWNPLPTDNSLHFKMSNSTNLTDANATTNSIGVFDENPTFVTSETKDTNNQTSSITLANDEFTEIEYSIEATNNATEATYCFRLTDAGTALNYIVYPEITIIGDENIFIKSLNSNGNEAWSTVKINVDMTGSDQRNPRIAMTENFGNATTTITWEDNRNGNIDIYAQIFDKDGNRQLGSDLQITSSSTDETSAVITIDGNDNIYISWVESGDIYLQKFNLQGNQLWSNPINLTSSAEVDLTPEISIDNSNNILLIWTTVEVSNNIYLASFDSSGSQNWKKVANIDNLNKNQTYPDVTSDASSIYISWTDDTLTNNNILTQKYDFLGNTQWTKDQKITDDSNATNQNYSTISITSDGHTFSAWHDERDNSGEIYATHFETPGAVTPLANVPLVIRGTKLINNNPTTYEYNQTHTTDTNGEVSIQLEWDTAYSITASSTLTVLTVQSCQPDPCPIAINADELKSIDVYVE